jgi:hypothetical protein
LLLDFQVLVQIHARNQPAYIHILAMREWSPAYEM